MPLLWRYLLRNYLKVFLLCVTGFISVLLVTRFQSIARFAATGASKLYILQFIFLQIPFILPLAIPISCLIGALLLFQKMSRSHELTALRGSGLGIFSITFPLILTGAIIGMANFTIVSEIAPKCRALSKNLAYQMTAVNPLCLLQKETLIKLKNTYIDMKLLKSGKYAEDVLFVNRNHSSDRIGLMMAKNLSLQNQKLLGTNVTFISSMSSKDPESFDHLVIENQAQMETDAQHLTQYLHSNHWNFGYDYLNLRMLRAKHFSESNLQKKFDGYALQEIFRRVSLGLAAFTFTLVGIAYGMEISREIKIKRLLWALSLMTFYLVTFIAAKSIKHSWSLSLLFHLIPHPIILFFSLYSFKQVARGAE